MNRLDDNSSKKNKKVRNRLLVFGIVCLFIISNIVVFLTGNFLATKGYVFLDVPELAAEDLSEISDISKYSDLFTIRSLLLAKYDGEIDDEALLEGAIKGMVEAVDDPYTVYMNSEEYESFISSNSNFCGIGAQIGVVDDTIQIVSVIGDSPAEEAGLQEGDIILQVDDYEVTDTDADAVVSRIRGTEGEPVTLTIERGTDVFEVEIVRAEIETQSVTGEIIEDNIGYIKISTFSDENVSEKFTTVLNELKEQGMEKLILDLRGNPGGYLEECVEIASNFIEEGEVVTYTIDKYDEEEVSTSVGGDAIGMPLVVLVNSGSASASEVVTGALKDYGVATIVGTTTFGKGIVQQLIPFTESDGETGALKVTVSKYYSPNGTNIQGTGIEPDVYVELSEEVSSSDDLETDNQFQTALEIIKEK